MGYPPAIEPVQMAPRTGQLNGKTLYLVDVRFDDSDLLLDEMDKWLKEHRPDIKTKRVSKSGTHSHPDPELFQEIAEHGAAMVMAGGH